MKKETVTMPQPIDMRDRIKERCDLAHIYAEDGAYYSAARVLRDLAEEVSQHAQRVHPGPVPK